MAHCVVVVCGVLRGGGESGVWSCGVVVRVVCGVLRGGESGMWCLEGWW